jgi:hypothetical protein
VIDVKPFAPWNAFSPMLLKPLIVRLRTYDNKLSFTIVLVNSPLPLNTLEDNNTFTPDLPYNVLLGPSVIPRPFKRAGSSKMAVIIPELRNASVPMLVTAAGIVIDVIPVIPWNAYDPMLLTDDGMVMDVKPVIPWKAFAPMLVTDDGMVIDVTVVAS